MTTTNTTSCRDTNGPPFRRQTLNVKAMQYVSQHVLCGIHDCSVFCRDKRKRVDYRSPIRHIIDIQIVEDEKKGHGNNQEDQFRDLHCHDDDDDHDDHQDKNGQFVTIYIHADFFLTHMCRRIVGLLVQVGLERVTPKQVAQYLFWNESKDTANKQRRENDDHDASDATTAAAMVASMITTAPPHGLCLEKVFYAANGIGKDPTKPAQQTIRKGADGEDVNDKTWPITGILI